MLDPLQKFTHKPNVDLDFGFIYAGNSICAWSGLACDAGVDLESQLACRGGKAGSIPGKGTFCPKRLLTLQAGAATYLGLTPLASGDLTLSLSDSNDPSGAGPYSSLGRRLRAAAG